MPEAPPPPRPTRTVLHVDMDAFFAAVEQRDRPELRGRPVIVGAPPDRRGVVAAASYEARRFGVHSAMPSREAGRRCPQGVFLPVRMRRYAEVSRQVFAIFERFTPLVEPLSIDEAFLDVTGTLRLFGPGPAIAEKLRRAIREETGLTASVGVAPNKFLAKLGSELNKPDGLTVVPGDEPGIRAFLAPLPVRRLWGAGEVTAGRLEAAGFATVGDVQRGDPARLERVVGARTAAHLRALAFGGDDRPVETGREEKSLSREHTFETDCAERERVAAVLTELVEDVGRRLRRDGRLAGTAHLKLRWKGFETIVRQRPLAPPCRDDPALLRAARALFAAERMAKPVRLVGFGVSGLRAAAPAQPDLFEAPGGGAAAKSERLSATVDAIRRRYGAASIRRETGAR